MAKNQGGIPPVDHFPKYNYVGIQDTGSVLLAQLTALRDEQPVLLSCLAFGRTFFHGVDLAGRSLAEIFAGSSTVTDSKEPAHYTSLETDAFTAREIIGYCFIRSTQGRFVNAQKKAKATTQHARPNFQVASLQRYSQQ